MALLLQVLLGGFLMGGIYCLISIGLSLTFGVMKIMNFAHGEFLMLGMYFCYFCLQKFGVDPYLSALILTPFMFLVGIITYHFLVRPIVKKQEQYQMLFMVGLQFFMQNMALAVFSSTPRTLTAKISSFNVHIGPVFVDAAKLIAMIISIIATIIFFYMMKRTDLGRKIRATAEDAEAAAAHGVNVDKVNHLAFGIGTACAALAAVLLAPIFQIEPTISNSYTTPAMIAIVLGGLGSFKGAAIGAYIVGISMEIGNYLFGGSMGMVVPLVIFILVLLFKPEGLLGVKKN